jgi:hypothetical protein
MSEFERQQPNYRLAETQYGDTLQIVAARELGNGNRWPELVWLNGLRAPYITDVPGNVRRGVLLSGSLIRIPAPGGKSTGGASDGRAYGRDAAMANRLLTADSNGDLAVVSGVDNLSQQLRHRVVTPRGQAIRHPDYGCLIWKLSGKANSPVLGFIGAEYVKSTLAADYRVSSVEYSKAWIDMDAIRIAAGVKAIDGGSIDLPPLVASN